MFLQPSDESKIAEACLIFEVLRGNSHLCRSTEKQLIQACLE